MRDLALADAAHDLCSPLASIGSIIRLILCERMGPLNEEQRQALLDVESTCLRIRQLVNEFITFGAIGAGLQLKTRVSEFSVLLTEAADDWSLPFRSKDIRLKLEIAPGLPPFRFDSLMIRRVLDILLDNAMKFTPAGGEVTVAAEPHFWERRNSQEHCSFGDRRKCGETGRNSVRLSVADTGIGIPAEYQQEIFEEFYSSPDGTRPSTGLGLSIARRVVKAHNGKIWVESSAGAGSRFFVLLPVLSCDRGVDPYRELIRAACDSLVRDRSHLAQEGSE